MWRTLPTRSDSSRPPRRSQLNNPSGYELDDPLEEDKDMPVPGLTHRYPDRVLMQTTHVCTMYCRFCTRKRATLTRGGWDSVSRDDERMIEYIQDHSEIRDVVVSGGDPLTLPHGKLKYFLDSLRDIKHVDIIRIGTRVPVTSCRSCLYDQELIDLLASAEKVWIQNPLLTIRGRDHSRGGPRLQGAAQGGHAWAVNNHSVLLKGVNDDLKTMRDLIRAMLRIKVRPYYIFHCDPVFGAGHFRTSVWKGLEIMEGLRGHISGLGIPTYVVDSPHGGGKIPMMPNYLISMSDDAVVLAQLRGASWFAIRLKTSRATIEPTRSRGASALLQGTKTVLVPEDNERMARRRQQLPMVSNHAAEPHHPCGDDGDSTEEHHEYANGHSVCM